MSARRSQAFATEEQAYAFKEGVEFVNDSALEVESVQHRPQNLTPWVVVMVDRDADLDDTCAASQNNLACTCPEGHDGPHVARDEYGVMFDAWEDEP